LPYATVSRLYKPTGSLDAQVDAYFVEGRKDNVLTWQRHLRKPIRLHPVAAKDLGSGDLHADFLRLANVDLYGAHLFDSLDEAPLSLRGESPNG
jgi:hypothetical protein